MHQIKNVCNTIWLHKEMSFNYEKNLGLNNLWHGLFIHQRQLHYTTHELQDVKYYTSLLVCIGTKKYWKVIDKVIRLIKVSIRQISNNNETHRHHATNQPIFARHKSSMWRVHLIQAIRSSVTVWYIGFRVIFVIVMMLRCMRTPYSLCFHVRDTNDRRNQKPRFSPEKKIGRVSFSAARACTRQMWQAHTFTRIVIHQPWNSSHGHITSNFCIATPIYPTPCALIAFTCH